MRKGFLLLAAIGVVMVTATGSWALNYATTNGAVMTITASGVPGSTPMTFKPSPKCNIDGMSVSTGFAHNGLHMSAIGVSGGQKYGMSSDTNKVFFKSIEPTDSAVTDITTVNSSALTGDGFSVMQ